MLIEKLKPDFMHEDDRGGIVQLARRGYSQFNVITSHSGAYRGGHYHKLNTEAFYVVKGKCEVTARKDDITDKKIFFAGDFFRIGPYITHDFSYLEDTILVSMYSLGVELVDGEMDIYS